MKFYIDNDYKCYQILIGGREFESNFFDGKCKKYIEGFRYIPLGESYTDDQGFIYNGEQYCAWKDYELLEEFQSQYEEMLEIQNDMSEALNVLGVKMEE